METIFFKVIQFMRPLSAVGSPRQDRVSTNSSHPDRLTSATATRTCSPLILLEYYKVNAAPHLYFTHARNQATCHRQSGHDGRLPR
jgi:hypothetical protein